jgi:tRNA modification GTPase
MTDTIFALSSAPGRAGVAVFRVSGPDARRVLEAVAGSCPPPRKAVLRGFRDAAGEIFDRGLALWFPGPASFTGEDSAELHAHGGPAVIEAAARALSAAGARPAEAGEFTRRAFEHGKLDLTEAEGLADLIDAETEAQRSQALAQMTGALRSLYESWRADLLAALAALEGAIDFPDEDDVPEALADRAAGPIASLVATMEAHLDDDRRGERVREGFTIALIGPPNAAKSSLLNALAGHEAAIVTDIPGTTRDVVEVRLVLGGFAVILADTAGLREASDVVESEGVRRALARAESADLRLGLADVSRETLPVELARTLTAGDALIRSQADLGPATPIAAPEGVVVFELSVKTGAGIADLEAFLEQAVQGRLGAREAPALSRARHRRGVEAARDALSRAEMVLAAGGHAELAALEVRAAVRALEALTGRIDVEDVLGAVFSQFCIGK